MASDNRQTRLNGETTDTYVRLRDELACLLDQAADLAVLSDEVRAGMRRTAERARGDAFHIVLAGGFQGGKSTTFNAICDGRVLSPMGAGTRTSGCLISAAPAAEAPEGRDDATAAESAQVIWRAAPALAAGFTDMLLADLRRLAPTRFAAGADADLNLDDPSDLRLARKAVEAQWQVWRQDRAGYDPRTQGRLDLLRAAALITRFWDDPKLRNLRRREFFPLEAIPGMVAFPEGWESRWAAGRGEDFDLGEALFLFIDSVRMRLRSPGLSRLGCVLVDCPGLFASRWDSRVAREAMSRADAILYIFDGCRPPRGADLSALRFILDNRMGYKLLFGCNLRGVREADGRRILNAGIAALAAEGVDIGPDNAVNYNALLGLRAAQATRLLEGNATTGANPPPGAGPAAPSAAALCVDIRRLLTLLEGDAPGGCHQPLDAALARAAAEGARIGALMDMAGDHVVKHKARTLLVENGARPALSALSAVEGDLVARESAARMVEKTLEERLSATEAALNRFLKECAGAIERLADPAPDRQLADDLWGRITALGPDLVARCAERIASEIYIPRNLPALFIARKGVEDQIIGIIREDLDLRMTETIDAWIREAREGRNPAYETGIAARVRDVSAELSRIWTNSQLSEMEILSGVGLPAFSGAPAADSERILAGMAGAGLLSELRESALSAAGLTGIFTAASGVVAGMIGLAGRIFWMVVASAVALLANAVILMLARGMMRETVRDEVKNRLRPAFDRMFAEMGPEARMTFMGFSAEIRRVYRDAFRAAVEGPQRIFEKRRARALVDFKTHQARRMATASSARRLREERISPLCRRFQDFIARAEAALP